MKSALKRIKVTCTSSSQMGKTLTLLYFDGNESFSSDGTGESSVQIVKNEKGKINYLIQGNASEKTVDFLRFSGIKAEII